MAPMTSAIQFPAYVIGLMSGTSADGVDAALLYTDGRAVAEAHDSLFVPYSDALRQAILALMRGKGDIAAVAYGLTAVHIEAVQQLLQKSGKPVALVGFHGQTIHHAPERDITVQIGDASLMAKTLGIPVVTDFRSNDMRHGGQGAPLVPLYHAALARTLPKPLMVVNIGGVANVTWIGKERSQDSGFGIQGEEKEKGLSKTSSCPESQILNPEPSLLAFDCGPGNALLDDWVHQHTGARYDKNGELGARGTVDESIVDTFLQDAFFARPAPKSLDRHHFAAFYSSFQRKLESTLPAVQEYSGSEGNIDSTSAAKMDSSLRWNNGGEVNDLGTADKVADGAATLTAITAAAIAKACDLVPMRPQQLLITGGGRHNPTLMRMICHYVNSGTNSSSRRRGEAGRGESTRPFGTQPHTTRNKQAMGHASNLKKSMTDAERKLWQALRREQLGTKFRRQQSIGNYIVDFLSVEHKLVLELDGGQHAKQKAHDEARTAFLNKAGYRVVRYWNNEVFENFEGVLTDISAYVREDGQVPPPSLSPSTGGGVRVVPVDSVGWNGDMLEAEAFAYLAARSVLGLPLSLPTTTGVSQPVTGGVFYPAPGE